VKTTVAAAGPAWSSVTKVFAPVTPMITESTSTDRVSRAAAGTASAWCLRIRVSHQDRRLTDAMPYGDPSRHGGASAATQSFAPRHGRPSPHSAGGHPRPPDRATSTRSVSELLRLGRPAGHGVPDPVDEADPGGQDLVPRRRSGRVRMRPGRGRAFGHL